MSNKTERVGFRISTELKDKLMQKAKSENKRFSDYVRETLEKTVEVVPAK